MPKKILIVDDDRELADELAEILREEGYFVENIYDSIAAGELIEKNTYDLYLFDYKMSGYSGAGLLKKLKMHHPASTAFIISGHPAIDKLLREEKVKSLVSAVIKKPFDVTNLLQEIRFCI